MNRTSASILAAGGILAALLLSAQPLASEPAYHAVETGERTIFRIETRTGRVSLCIQDASTRSMLAVTCGPWSD